jgi:drug/metabolite transporter (DMT)-like permease
VPALWAVIVALLSVYIVWGSTYLAIRFALEGFPPFFLGAIRMAIAGALMFVVLWLSGTPMPTKKQWRNLAYLGLFMTLLSNGFVNFAEQEVSSGLAAVAVASMPLWAGVFFAMRGRHPSRLEWIGLVVGFLGVVWLNAGGSLSGSPKGMVALIISAVAWAYGSVWSVGKDLPSPFMSASGQMLCGSIWMLLAGFINGDHFAQPPSGEAWAALLYLALFGSIVGFSAYVWLLNNVRPALATSYAYVNPPIAVLFGAWLGAERFDMHDMGAMAVILAGVLIITLAKAIKR